jgi:hypothetical protein
VGVATGGARITAALPARCRSTGTFPSTASKPRKERHIMGFKYGVSTWRIDAQGYKWGWKV